MYFSKIFQVLLAFGFWINICSGTHIIGGEITYKCIGNSRYVISMTVYRDCKNGSPSAPFDDPAYVGFFNQNNQLDTSIAQGGVLRMYLSNNDTLSPQLQSPCYVQKDSICVHKSTYTDTVVLLFKRGGYKLTYQRCCRNGSIQNTIDPLMTGASFTLEISEMALMSCNSSPVFKAWPPLYICVDEPIVFDHGAIDAEGDSILFELCDPLVGSLPSLPQPNPPSSPPYASVLWKDPYSLANLMGGTPLTLDRSNGQLRGLPNTLGQFVVGVCISEYRQGVVLSQVRRDFQYNVGVCSRRSASFIQEQQQCGLDLNISGDSSIANILLWEVYDSLGFRFVSRTRNLSMRLPKVGTYYIRLIADPNTACPDTLTRIVNVFESNLQPSINYTYSGCKDDSLLFTIINNPKVNGDSILRVFNVVKIANQSFNFINIDTILINIPRGKAVTITQNLMSLNGCTDSSIWIVQEPVLLGSYPRHVSMCLGDTAIIRPDLIDGQLKFNWSPSVGILSRTDEPIVLISPIINTQYIIARTSILTTCTWKDTVDIELFSLVLPFDLQVFPSIVRRGEAFTITAPNVAGATYFWNPTGIVSTQNWIKSIGSVTQRFYVTISSGMGVCIDTSSILVELRQEKCEEPFIFIPNAFTPNGDDANDRWRVHGGSIVSIEVFVFDRWGNKVFFGNGSNIEWDGTYNGAPCPNDVYGYYVKIICGTNETIIRKGNLSLIR